MDIYDRFKDPKHIWWAKKVKERDGFTCQVCNASDTYLNSHHMDSWDLFVEERFDIDNGATLCSKCHIAFHNIYGHGRNTKHQFEEFCNIINIIKKIVK